MKPRSAAVTDSKLYSDFTNLTIEMNLQRIPFVAALSVCFQIFNLCNPVTYQRPGLVYAVIAIIALSLGYLVAVSLLQRRILEKRKVARAVFLSYWVFLIVSMEPFFVTDILYTGIPVNTMLIAAILVIVPLFTGYEAIPVFIGFLAYNLILTQRYGADQSYLISLSGGCFAALALSYWVQRQYVYVIGRLHAETRSDPLTGLLNRKGGYDKMQTVLELCKRHGQMIAVYMVDIDHFKQINDTFGHVRGDEILRLVADAMQSIFCRSSDVVCRYGGEEIFICSSIPSSAIAASMAESLRLSVEALNIPAGRTPDAPHLTVSVGYTIYRPAAGNLKVDDETLIEQADKALYVAKETGRNRTVRFTA